MTERSPSTGPFLVEIAEWTPGVYQWQTDDVILGGPDGIDNWPTQALANRTLWLKGQVEALMASLVAVGNALAAHESSRNHPTATDTQVGFVELATPEETAEGSDNQRAVTPAGVAAAIAAATPNLGGYLRYNVGATLEAGYWTAPAALEIEGGVVTPDLAAGNVFVLSGPLTSNLTLAMPDEEQLVGRAGMMLVILAQDATGGRTLTLAPGYHLAGGSWSTAPNAVNLLWITSDGGGTALDVVIAQRGE